MFENIDTLRQLYDKINKGVASEYERAYYDVCVKTSCIDTDTLLKLIKTGKIENKHVLQQTP